MIFLTEKSIRQNIKKFGFKDTNSRVVELLNRCIENFASQSIKKALKQHRKFNKQSGRGALLQGGSGAVGRTVLPSEYFGINSGNYLSNSDGTNMNVTNSVIRPSIITHDLSGSIKGGKNTKESCGSKCNEQRQCGGSGAHGHTVFQSEYFGVNSGNFFEKLQGSEFGTNMNVTNSMIRPAILTHDLSGAIKGGSSSKYFNVSKSAFKNALNEARNKYQNNVSIPQETVVALHNQFEKLITEVLSKAEKKSESEQLQHNQVQEILQQRKYQILRS